MTDHDDRALRVWARSLFGNDEPVEQDSPSNVVAREGGNPPALISDDARLRDYARRLFDPGYAATEQELP